MELPQSERFAYIQEMFPNIPDEVLAEQLRGLPQSSSVDQLVDYFLSVSENFSSSPSSTASSQQQSEEDKEGKALEMISLTPGVWNPKTAERSSDSFHAKRKDQQEAEDEALARQLYAQEMKNASNSSSSSDTRTTLAEANALRLSRGSNQNNSSSSSSSSSVALNSAKRKELSIPGKEQKPLPNTPAPVAAKQQPSSAPSTSFSLRDQMEEIRRARRNDWRENRGGSGDSHRASSHNIPSVGVIGKAPIPIYNNTSSSSSSSGRILREDSTSNNNASANRASSSSSLGYYGQLREARDKWKKEWRNTKMGRQRVWTLNDIEKQRKLEEETAAKDWLSSEPERRGVHTLGNTVLDPLRIGKEALELSNAFRQRNKLPPLKWHQALCDIGVKHSRDMAEGKVPFGHQGFDQRVRQFPMSVHSAAENVAMSNGFSDVAKVAVDGWIQSPGHRKNLLSNSVWCGIGVYRGPDGSVYLTQLFAS